MTEDQVSQLFKPFTKIIENRTLNKEGVGLGLALSQNIAISLGGRITVTSEAGVGSIFTLALPASFSKEYQISMISEMRLTSLETRCIMSLQEIKVHFFPKPSQQIDQSQDNPPIIQIIEEEEKELEIGDHQRNSCNCPKSLIVDDEGFNISVLQGMLKKVGFPTSDKAHDGTEAVRMVQWNF